MVPEVYSRLTASCLNAFMSRRATVDITRSELLRVGGGVAGCGGGVWYWYCTAVQSCGLPSFTFSKSESDWAALCFFDEGLVVQTHHHF